MLVEEFRRELPESFPFVVLDRATDAAALKNEQPFLFLSIMTIMAHRTPSLQLTLADTFKEQVAARIVGNSLKGLEVLQGLLLHAAYYQHYYRPGKQQLALIIQMCVATAQELGTGRKCIVGNDTSKSSSSLSGAEERAYLGTFYLAAA
jgi:hypothetical protein